MPERLCDGVAELGDLERGGVPFAALLEVQTMPDATMPGRLMLAGGLLWLTVKPTTLPGDRYELLGVVINLTGRGDASLAKMFAQLVNRGPAWENAMEGLTFIESPYIANLLAGAEAKGKAEGKIEGTLEALLRLIGKRFRDAPEELTSALRACQDEGQLAGWFDAAVEATTLDEFRRQTGL